MRCWYHHRLGSGGLPLSWQAPEKLRGAQALEERAQALEESKGVDLSSQ